jgi:hypothetical protein
VQKNDLYLIMVVILIWGMIEIIALKLVGATGSDVAAWVQAFGTVGAVGAAVVLARRAEADRIRSAERTATLITAAHMADWLRAAAKIMEDTKRYVDTEGQSGDHQTHLPQFAYATDLSLIAGLRPRHAAIALKLKETVERLNRHVVGTEEFEDAEAALSVFYAEGTKLFASCREFYFQLASIVGLPGDPNQSWELDAMVDAWNSTVAEAEKLTGGAALPTLRNIPMKV